MAQPSVSREPSMEEILASIRRIIESNEPGAAKGLGGSMPPLYGGDEDETGDEIHLTVDDDEDGEPMISAANGMMDSYMPVGAQERREEPVAEQERSAQKSVSLADLAARVRAASERVADHPPVATPMPVQAASIPVQANENSAVNPVLTARMAELRGTAPQQTASVQLVQVETVSVSSAEIPSAPRQETESFQHTLARSELSEPKGLLSLATGEQVARSFGELAAAVDGTQRRSLDEMAEEMLRPMLQDWLDDNLPTLVERLVREEIERIARGPRR
ncbi:DUF2497 domain-containing protein [Rhizobium sp. CG5]|uniref:PopZ family protein n=1 Tax=Rhizobium sp. CG5 TaxID=2726076 RepID=UPI002033F244|nr:PopZ family protein [Rhizobium sp. CG5]MCM2472179.1 DUF2497 domain-containing protein [Rhizobium sp. CG5]